LFGAIAVGPYGRRGVRVTLALVSFSAFLGSAFWLMTYLGLLDQRRAIETRLTELRAQALGSGSTLACLERTGDTIETACAQTLFAAPETLAAANVYTAARLDLLIAAARYSGPRTPQFDDAVAALQRSLQQDPFGLTANILVRREGCTAERCDAIAVFRDPARVRDNIRQKTFDANVARHAASWRAAPAPGATAAPAIAPTGGETRAPIPDRYTLPSSASIPPVSIMSDEPARPPPAPPAARDRPAAPPTAAATEQPSAPVPAAAQPAAPPPAAPRKQQRRETKRPSGPLSIAPKQ